MEHIRTPKVENVHLIDRASGHRKASIGTLYLSATHTIFVENNPETRKETWVLHSMVSSVERLPTTPAGSQLILRCKDFRVFQILIPQERDGLDVHASLVRLSRPEKYNELYCLSFNPNLNKEEREESWTFVDLVVDYKRMGVPNNLWVTTAANSEYRVCDTYPSELFVPKSATPAIIVGSSRFRSRGRFPSLSYFHQDTLAAVCRCSQPLSGFSGRCQEDEMMLQAVMKSNPGSDYIYVVDTRPKLNAMANRAAGKGYENEDHYTNIKLQFVGIENIHVMRSSQQKIIDVGEMRSPSMTDFLWGLENSGWLKHIKAILDAGVFIARAVADEGVSVLVHCSDGWDRTAQACSVASILLDPYYRTIKGLMVLIERDWVSFGHKFSHRYAHLDGDPKEVSPVIDQFLECVWQLSEQFPCAFEFNEHFLIAIHSHVYSCQYGTFLGNCQRERRDMRLRERSHSLWPHMWKDRGEYTNPLYKAELSQGQGVLRPNTAPYCFKMWKGLYNYVEKSMPPRQSPADFLSAMREESQQLEEELTNHQERLAALKGKPITWEKIEVQRRVTSRLRQRHCGPDPPTTYTDPSPAVHRTKPQNQHPAFALSIKPCSQLKCQDPDDLSTCSDLESGVADLSSRSSGGGDYGNE
ncbi:LOW QUALITY PROTEIN: myotubularin-related protein 7-like [Hippoglossus stenolepis]|uniref:LOW QUALITY PROTEIN: myotubularin-related protein 7-like n=1 Tax=Hippoglossus stenolepis TaxID=195615 RepID=UPI001FB01DA7|nr:LOW QUALITY PROTEIN: myotubularin-related protein 7-like [Hippoglossus stenolepis]